MESSHQEEILASIQEAKVLDFEELKTLQRRGPKLLDFRRKVRKSRGLAHYNLSKEGILLFRNSRVIPTDS